MDKRLTYFVPENERQTPTTLQITRLLELEGLVEATSTDSTPDVVWPLAHEVDELTRRHRLRATVSGQLLSVDILEDKACLALLQSGMRCHTLETQLVDGFLRLEQWCRRQFDVECGIWVVKIANANGGEGIVFVSRRNWRVALSGVRATLAPGSSEVYVVQRYVDSPKLWGATGRKFHYRVYALLKGDLSLYLYPRAFAHVANEPFTLDLDAKCAFPASVHVANVATNISDLEKFSGYHVVSLPTECPSVWEDVKLIASELIAAATLFLSHQVL